jgi:hypothetical protein
MAKTLIFNNQIAKNKFLRKYIKSYNSSREFPYALPKLSGQAVDMKLGQQTVAYTSSAGYL